MVDWRRRTGQKKTQQEGRHGKKASSSADNTADNTGAASDHLPSVWKSDAYGPSQSSNGDQLSRSDAVDSQSLSMPQSDVSTLPPANASGGRRGMGATPWGVRTGRDCPGRGVALSATTQYPPDS